MSRSVIKNGGIDNAVDMTMHIVRMIMAAVFMPVTRSYLVSLITPAGLLGSMLQLKFMK